MILSMIQVEKAVANRRIIVNIYSSLILCSNKETRTEQKAIAMRAKIHGRVARECFQQLIYVKYAI